MRAPSYPWSTGHIHNARRSHWETHVFMFDKRKGSIHDLIYTALIACKVILLCFGLIYYLLVIYEFPVKSFTIFLLEVFLTLIWVFFFLFKSGTAIIWNLIRFIVTNFQFSIVPMGFLNGHKLIHFINLFTAFNVQIVFYHPDFSSDFLKMSFFCYNIWVKLSFLLYVVDLKWSFQLYLLTNLFMFSPLS